MIPTQKPEYADLRRQLADPLRELIRKDLDGPIEAQRVAQIVLAKRNYLYWQSKQYLAPKFDDASRVVDWVSVLEGKKPAKLKFASVYNIIYSDGMKFIAVVGQRRQNQKCVADDPDDEKLSEIARDAGAALRRLHRQWRLQHRIKSELAFHLWVTGPVFGLTRYVANGHKYGWSEEPIWDVESKAVHPGGFRCLVCGTKAEAPRCPVCGTPMRPETFEKAESMDVPVVRGFEKYANGATELDFLSIFHVSTPFGTKDIPGCSWASVSEMAPKMELKALYEELREQEPSDTEADSAADIEATQALEEIQAPGSEQLQIASDTNRWQHEHRWLRPEIYYGFAKSLRDPLFEEFPKGLRITRVGNKIIKLAHEKLDDYLAVCKTGTGEYISSPALCQPVISIQDDTNDFFNLARETIVRAIPKTIVSSDLIDTVALEKNEPKVAEMIRAKLGGGDIAKQMGALPMSRFSDQLMPFWMALRETSREIDGIQPAIFGGGETTNTWREASQRKNQALMQLQPPFDEMQNFVSRISENGVREEARYASGNVRIAPEDQSGMEDSYELDLELLEEEGWHVEAEESVPVTYGEKVERLSAVAQENPELADSLGMHHPMNVARMQEFFGIDGMYNPGQYERSKALKRIQRLLQEEPIPQFDPVTGQAVMETSSIPPDPFEDKDHAFFAEIFRAWCNSPAGQTQKEKNPRGYENVRLHGMEQDFAAQMAAMPLEGAEEQPPGEEVPQSTIPPVGESGVRPEAA